MLYSPSVDLGLRPSETQMPVINKNANSVVTSYLFDLKAVNHTAHTAHTGRQITEK